MIDPLSKFNWDNFYRCYDCMCKQSGRFDISNPALSIFPVKIKDDRTLYYELLNIVEREKQFGRLMSIPTYIAIIYWKLYSIAGNPTKRIYDELVKKPGLLNNLSQFNYFPSSIKQDKASVFVLVNQTLKLNLYSMRLPVCSTVLHFIYPDVIPIFDKMTLSAIEPGLDKKTA